jgi:hypothetical protein
MDKKIIVILIAAIVIVAGVCVYFAFGQGEKLGGTEAYTDIKVGDEIKNDFDVTLTADVTLELPISEALSGMYFQIVGATPIYSTLKTFNDKVYECFVYDIDENGEIAEYYVIEDSGVILGVSYEDGTNYKLTGTSCDVTKTIEEQEVTVGTTYTYLMRALIPGMEAVAVEGYSVNTVTEIGNGDNCKLNTTMNSENKDMLTLKLASIEGGVYKFEGNDNEYTKDGAMSYYAYTSCLNDIKEIYGEDSIVMGKKYSEKIVTAYGNRDVTVQEMNVDVFGTDTFIKFYYGSKDVLYKTYMETAVDDVFELTLIVDLVGSDAVKAL